MITVFRILLIITFSLSYNLQIFGQEKVKITAGVGFPEMFNIGVRYLHNQTQIGLSVGGAPVFAALSVSGDLFYHFDRVSDVSTVSPWYCRVGLDYWKLNRFHAEGNFLLFNFRLGRDFNISDKAGVEIDAGAFFHGKGVWSESAATPSLGIRIFFKV